MEVRLFFSYARKDIDFLDNLKNHLMSLQREGLISTLWHDRDITAGTEWEEEIDHHLNTAQIIVLLVSADFIASEYCYSKEVLCAMELHEQGKARVIPIILRPVEWRGMPFSKLRVLPSKEIPITDSQWNNQDEAYLNIVQGIRLVIVELSQKEQRAKSTSLDIIKYTHFSLETGFSMKKLKVTPYRWAITHLLKEGDTDLFPRPFEFDAIGCYQDEVERVLQETNIDSYSWFEGRSAIIPKDVLSFRCATQLDPWDSLILSALIYEFGDKIEKKRIPYANEVIFSYRFAPLSDGTMYNRDADWPSFWAKSRERAKSIGGYVAIADVSNYYNQIYHPSLKNHLQVAGVPKEVAESIIRLCTKPHNTSRGVPVGPHATHLLAECVFDPIDRSLLAEGYTFCRFVDDIHIFCQTRQQAQIAFYDLADILDKQQKLSLQSHKLKILSAEEFIEYADRVITERPYIHLERDIIEVIDRYSNGDRYRNIDFNVLSENDLHILSQQNLEKLLSSYLDQNEPNFVRIRWLFRRLAQVGVPGAVPFAVTNLEQFSPAVADLAGYLLSARYNYTGIWEHLGDQILHALELPIIQHSEYLTVILLDLFTRLPTLNHIENLLRKYRTSSPTVRRKIIRAATAHHADYWLHLRKEELSSADPWLKRALIAGAITFSKDECIRWLQSIEKETTKLEEFIITPGSVIFRSV